MYQLPKREIEFRAWDGDENKMFALLDFFQGNKYHSMLYASDELVGKGNIHFMQYTGLKDKNGVKIFEGDFLRIEVSLEETTQTHEYFEVIFSEGCFCLKMLEGEYALCEYLHQGAEVIGNVFEHPDLIPTPQGE